MTKHIGLHTTLLTLLFFSLVLFSCQSPKSGLEVPTKRPNIIYILADDLGYGELGSYGQELIETPNLDALAEGGMRFTQHYSGAPVCAPARCVLLTGKHTGHAYIRGNDEWKERGDVWDYEAMFNDPNLEGQRPVPADSTTIADLLKEVGYSNAIIGKWGLGGPLTEGVPNNQGFDFFYGYNCQRQAHTFYPKHLWKNREKVILNNAMVAPRTKLPEGADPDDPQSYAAYQLSEYAPTLMQREALQFIRVNRDQPFFLYYATPIPHLPLQAPTKWVQYYQEKFGEESPYIGDQGYFPNYTPKATYAAMISYLDEQVGEIVTELKKLGLYENTIIFFSSDNGPTYTGGTDTPHFRSGGPFKCELGWGKGFVHEGGIRVPFIANWPGKISAGSQSDHISAFWDVLPTICELSGAPIPGHIDGISMVPTLLERGGQKKHDFLYWEFPAYKGQQAVRWGQWKGIRKNIFEGNLTIELYDLQNDLQEQHNIADAHPEIVEKIESMMSSAHKPAVLERFKFKELGDD